MEGWFPSDLVHPEVRLVSTSGIDLVLVLPCYNEAQRAPWNEIGAFVTEDTKVALVLVDDGSTDDTSAILNRMEAERSQNILAVDAAK